MTSRVAFSTRGCLLAVVSAACCCTPTSQADTVPGADPSPPAVEQAAHFDAPDDGPELGPALESSCRYDRDCGNSLAHVRDDDTCCLGCSATPAAVESASKRDAWCAEHVGDDCPQKKCRVPPQPVCRDGACVHRR